MPTFYLYVEGQGMQLVITADVLIHSSDISAHHIDIQRPEKNAEFHLLRF